MAADKTRLKTRLGALSKDALLAVEDAIRVHLGLREKLKNKNSFNDSQINQC